MDYLLQLEGILKPLPIEQGGCPDRPVMEPVDISTYFSPRPQLICWSGGGCTDNHRVLDRTELRGGDREEKRFEGLSSVALSRPFQMIAVFPTILP